MSNSGITLTSSMRTNLLNLQKTQALFDVTQNKLSTGKKVNSAVDNPSSFFTAQSLSTRAGALEGLLDGMGQAVQTIKAADTSITSMKKLVEQATSLANSARDTSNTAATKTGTVDLGPLGAPTEVAGVNANDTFSIRLGAGDTITGTKNVSLTQTMEQISTAIPSTNTLAIKVGDNNFVKIVVLSADTVEALTKKINDNTKLKGLVTASVVDGKFQIKSTDAKNAITVQSLTGAGTANNTITTALGLDTGFSVKVVTAGTAVITGDAVAGLTSASTLSSLGISPTPAKIRVTVGENVTELELSAGATVANLDTALEAIDGIGSASIASTVFSVTGDAGKAIKIEDVTGNLASTLGIKTSDYVKPTTGGIQKLVDDINALSTDIKAEVDKNGYLKISSTTGDNIVITDTANATGVNGKAAASLGISGLADNGTNVRKSYSEQFDAVLNQIDQIVQNADTSYKGVNLLNGDDLTVNFNENRTSSLLIQGSTLDTAGLGLNEARNEWKSSADIDRALADIDTATSRLETKASELGQNLSIIQTREDFTENMINTLTTGADSLTLADMNEEAVNLLALQVRQQLGTNALSLASQSQQGVLRLF
ncbi:MAG: flagellin [Alphaproteobacteria bacterium ADurb.Bin438]|nr:MAG: flagellin [Alphaproteobacteria bacterium ADurb.Bin438]